VTTRSPSSYVIARGAIGSTDADSLNGFGAAWVQIDEPKFRFSIRQNYLPQ
jgi:hypothetical protein